MMDEDTITIAYREWRGEPRGKLKKGQHDPTQGDCIDCMACVNVCPMGIDIRDGQQLECITCGLCIDACNETMDRIGKPRGLVDYMALKDEASERAGQPAINVWRHILRPRTLMYFTLWGGIGVGLIVALFMRSPIDFNITPNRDPLFVVEPDGAIRNIYTLRLRNKAGEDTTFRVSVVAPEGIARSSLSLSLQGQSGATVQVPADETMTQRLYIMAAPGSKLATSDRTEVQVWVEDTANSDRASTETVFNGKAK